MEHDPHRILAALSAASVACFGLGGMAAGLAPIYYAGLTGVAAHYAWQIKTLDTEDR